MKSKHVARYERGDLTLDAGGGKRLTVRGLWHREVDGRSVIPPECYAALEPELRRLFASKESEAVWDYEGPPPLMNGESNRVGANEPGSKHSAQPWVSGTVSLSPSLGRSIRVLSMWHKVSRGSVVLPSVCIAAIEDELVAFMEGSDREATITYDGPNPNVEKADPSAAMFDADGVFDLLRLPMTFARTDKQPARGRRRSQPLTAK